MVIKLFHLNIFQGKFLSEIISFLQQSSFDILQFQEVTGGVLSRGGVWTGPRGGLTQPNEHTVGVDCFGTLKKRLLYQGVMVKTIGKKNDPSSYYANATFYRQHLQLLEKKEIFLKAYMEMGHEFIPADKAPRAALITKFIINEKPYYFVNTHLAWGPTPDDQPYKLEQAKKLYEYVKALDAPFVLTGDFNLTENSQVVRWFEGIGRNLIKEYNIVNTLNPRIHAAKTLFPKGLAVDYAFAHQSLKVVDFSLVDAPDLSDHFGFMLTLDL